MKKKLSAISVMLTSTMILSIAAPMTVFAEQKDPEQLSGAIEKRSVTAYRYSMEDTAGIECLFTSDLPDVPYISAIDYVSNIYDDIFTETRNDDGTYTMTNPNGKMVVDTNADTIYFESFDDFMSADSKAEGTSLDSPYVDESIISAADSKKGLTLDYSEYGIDLIENDSKVYFPLTTISDLFFASYNSAMYVDGNIYFIHSMDEVENPYVDMTSQYGKTERSFQTADYAYNELCFVMDNFYGRPSKSAIASLVEEKGFDKALDEFSDETRFAKNLLRSESASDFIIGLAILDTALYDGGHTAMAFPFVSIGQNYSESPLNAEVIVKNMLDPNTEGYLESATMNSGADEMEVEVLNGLRDKKYRAYELVKSWDDESKSRFVVKGDTGVFAFDSFENEAVYAFKWSMDYAAEKGLKNIVIDLSCNRGGNSAVVSYMMAVMTNQKYHNNKYSFKSVNTLTGNTILYDDKVDLNLDGVFDEKDKEVVYDMNFAVLSSKYSFSCGNLLPILAKDEGILVIGEKSGGGSCMLSVFNSPDGFIYSLSGYVKYISKDASDTDLGAAVDYDLTKRTENEYGLEQVDYSGLYDVVTIGDLVKEFYDSKEEPSQQSEEPSDEPSQHSEEPSGEPSLSSGVAPVPDSGNVKTGDSSSAPMIVLVMVLVSGTAFIAVRKRDC